jgi:hypothetical protein
VFLSTSGQSKASSSDRAMSRPGQAPEDELFVDRVKNTLSGVTASETRDAFKVACHSNAFWLLK